MRYSPILDSLAALPLTLLVKPSDAQHDADRIACFCPFCKGKSTTPHFIIYKNIKGGLYGTPVMKWMCTETKRTGYGAVELLAAMRGLPMAGDDLRQVCLELAQLQGIDYPELHARDWRTVAERPQQTFSFMPTADFSPQELEALGCTVRIDAKGLVRYGFDTWREGSSFFTPDMINKDFRIYSLQIATLPATMRKGEEVSEVIHGTPFNPLFACFTDDSMQCGCLFRPGTDEAPIPFSNNDEDTPRKIGRWLTGDRVFALAKKYADERTTGVRRAIDETGTKEDVKTFNTVWQGKDQLDVPIDDKDIKARAVVYCTSPQDAVATFYHLQALRHTYTEGNDAKVYYHVAFTFTRTDFSTVHHRQLARFADNVYILFPCDMKSLRLSRMICRRHRDVYRAQLPDTFHSVVYQRYARLYNRAVHTVRDFFLAYNMPYEERYRYDGDLNKLFSKCFSSAVTTNPFEYKEKRDRNGNLKETYYIINPATVWEFMASEGYVRDVDDESTDKIGRFVHLDWPFVDELDKPSMVAAVNSSLVDYAKSVARTGTDDFVLMKQAVAHSKEINEKSIAAIPPFKVDYSGGYGKDVEHFFYENGALRITKTDIRLIPYTQLDFNVDRSEVLHWRYTTPFKGDNAPFSIDENPEYVGRKALIEEHRNQTDDNGHPLYTLQQIAQQRSDLSVWGRLHRWLIDFKATKLQDMWPSLRVLRGFANEHWNEEEELLRSGSDFNDDQKAELNGHFANLLFCLGRILWRYRGSKSNCLPYLMENTVDNERKAQGGSGKSSFVKVFAACAGYVYNVDCKNLEDKNNLAKSLATFRLHHHRVIHWEDWESRDSIKMLYNFITSGISVRKMFDNAKQIDLDGSPGMIVSSNYPPSDMDDSSMRRLCIGGFSHRFCGENIIQNRTARQISDIMPDFTGDNVENMKLETRNQIAYICALAVQFVMKYDEKVDAPQDDLRYRTLVRSLGDSFVRWAQNFFEQTWIYGNPVDLDSAMQEYIRDYTDASDSKADKYSRKAFYQRILDYCQTVNVICNPPHLYKKNSREERRRYFSLKAWVTEIYFAGNEWKGDTSVEPKAIRQLEQSQYVVFFYRSGKDKIPADREELMTHYKDFIKQPDPAPFRDENGDVVALTEDEQQRLQDYQDRRQGKKRYAAPQPETAPAKPQDEDLPF